MDLQEFALHHKLDLPQTDCFSLLLPVKWWNNKIQNNLLKMHNLVISNRFSQSKESTGVPEY
jgi:hypothetical protein